MKTCFTYLLPTLLFFSPVFHTYAEDAQSKTPMELFSVTLQKLVGIVEPTPGAEVRTFSTRLEIVRAEGLPKELAGQSATLAFQAPDRLAVSAEYKGKTYSAGRDQQQLWIHVPDKKFGVVGKAGEARFLTSPEKKDATKLGPLKLPLPKEQLALLPLLMNVNRLAEETIDETRCHVLSITPKPEAIEALKIPQGTLKLWIRETDYLPACIGYSDGKSLNVEARLHGTKLDELWPEEKWKIPAREGDKVEVTALGHLTRFASVTLANLGGEIPALGPATGERRVVATSGKGRLELHDSTRVLYLEGTPEEMGTQHGALLKKEIQNVLNRILYGVGVGSSFAKGRWFFGEIEEAQSRLKLCFLC